MQKIIYLIVFFIYASFYQAFSQPLDDQFGIKAGININTLGGKELGWYPSIGYHAGFAYEAIVNEGFSIQPELLFSLQGATLEQSLNTRLKYYYLNLPIMAKIYLAEGFSIEAGPQVGYLMWANFRNDFFKEGMTEEVRRSDVSLAFGLGYRLQNNIGFSLRYTYGLTNTNKTNVAIEYRENNRVFQASVAFIFN